MVNELPLGPVAPFESIEGDGKEVHQTLLEDKNDGEGVLINPRSIQRMRVEKAEATRTEISSESKS